MREIFELHNPNLTFDHEFAAYGDDDGLSTEHACLALTMDCFVVTWMISSRNRSLMLATCIALFDPAAVTTLCSSLYTIWRIIAVSVSFIFSFTSQLVESPMVCNNYSVIRSPFVATRVARILQGNLRRLDLSDVSSVS